MILIYSITLKFCFLVLVKTCRTKTFLTQSDLILRARIIFSFKVILHEIIRNDDTALQHCWDIVSNVYNIVPTSKSCVDCKTVRIFAYSSTREQSNKRCGTRLKTESETAERLFSSLASHALRACEARAVRAHKGLTARVTDFFTDFEEKTDCFAV